MVFLCACTDSTKRIESKQSVALDLCTLLAVALHQYVRKPVESYDTSCTQSAQQLKLYQFRMAGVEKKLRDPTMFFKNRKQENQHFASTKHFKKKHHSRITLKNP